jgi:hypothetical protein
VWVAVEEAIEGVVDNRTLAELSFPTSITN